MVGGKTFERKTLREIKMKKLTDREIQIYRERYSDFFRELVKAAADLELARDGRGLVMILESVDVLLQHIAARLENEQARFN